MFDCPISDVLSLCPALPEARIEGGWALKPELCQSDAPIGVFGTLKLKKVSRKAGTVGKSFTAMGLN